MQLLRKSSPNRPKREVFFVRIPTPDGKAAFCNATEHLGQPMPYAKPQATCAMRVTDNAVLFSFLQLNKKSAKNIAEAPLEIPRGPLAKLDRKASRLADLPADRVVLEISVGRPRRPRRPEDADATTDATTADPAANGVVPTDAPAADPAAPSATVAEVAAPAAPEVLRYELTIRRDENGTATLDMDDDPGYDLPYGAVRASLYIKSPSVPRVIAVSFIGYPGRPGAPETVTRLASMILFSMTQLTEFRILSGTETVAVPAPPTRWAARPAVRRPEDTVSFSVPVWLFSEALAPVAAGSVGVEVDLENANPMSDRLLFHFHPDDNVEPHFAAYRQIFEMSIAEYLRLALGDDEIASITYDIVLNAVDSGTLERLREAAATVPGLDLSPSQKRAHA